MEPNTCIFNIVFFISVFLIVYTYVIFPTLLGFLARRIIRDKDDFSHNDEFPGVSILIAVYNEELVINQKLESILNSDYPKGKLEIIVGSDASNDLTEGIVRSLTIDYPVIKFYQFPERRGKPSVINDLVSYATYPIVILTDANVFFEKGLIGLLIRHFKNENNGLVGANILNVGMKKDGISIQEKSYIERENIIKYREGILWGCMMGPFGGCYALRKNLFEKIPAGFLVDDFYISMVVIEKGFRCINDLEAICYEDVSDDIFIEYKRKSRISAGNFQNLKRFGHFLFKPFTPEGFCFISHKFLRWMTPFFIIFSLMSLIILSFHSRIYFYLLTGEIVLLIAPFLDRLAVKLGIHWRFLRFVSYFSFMNLALLKGFFHFIKGINSGIWTPTKRG